jgi:hypothetical protein
MQGIRLNTEKLLIQTRLKLCMRAICEHKMIDTQRHEAKVERLGAGLVEGSQGQELCDEGLEVDRVAAEEF